MQYLQLAWAAIANMVVMEELQEELEVGLSTHALVAHFEIAAPCLPSVGYCRPLGRCRCLRPTCLTVAVAVNANANVLILQVSGLLPRVLHSLRTHGADAGVVVSCLACLGNCVTAPGCLEAVEAQGVVSQVRPCVMSTYHVRVFCVMSV